MHWIDCQISFAKMIVNASQVFTIPCTYGIGAYVHSNQKSNWNQLKCFEITCTLPDQEKSISLCLSVLSLFKDLNPCRQNVPLPVTDYGFIHAH